MNFSDIKNIKDLLKIAEVSKEMRDFFEQRTAKHINLVQKYCQLIHNYDPERFSGIIKRGEEHDQSKYAEPEVEPYIYITWDYRCKDLEKDPGISEEMRDKMDKATEHHIKHNKHHPEYHDNSRDSNLINRKDRDAIPDKIIDATAMKDIDIAEMLADWCAMSEEKGNSPREWADKNVNKRWKFTDDQIELIYELIHAIWKTL